MAQNRPRYVSTFRAPTEYELELERARRQKALAEALAQQEYQPMEGAAAPIPRAAPLVKALQGYLTARAGRQAEEAASKAGQMEEEYAQRMEGRMSGGRPAVIEAIGEEGPTVLEAKYRRDPAEAAAMASTSIGTAALKNRPIMAARLAEMMKAPSEAEYGTTPQYDSQGKAFVVNKAGQIRYLDGVTKPEEEAPTSFREFKLSQTTPGYREFIESRTPKTNVDVSYGAPVAGVDAQGNPIYFQPSRTGGAPSIIPGVKPKPEAMGANESTAALFADRMAEAAPIFDVLAPPTVGATAKGAIPGVGNIMLSPQNRQFMQAERNFISAVLRKESGAAISPSEFDEARKLYIPQAGDDPQTLEMKRQTRINAVRGISQGAGPSYKMPPLTPPDGVTPAEWAAMTLEERRRFAR